MRLYFWTRRLHGVRADVPRRPSAGADREALVAPLGADDDVDHVGGGIGDVEVQIDLLLPVQTWVEVTWGVGAERRVDGVLCQNSALLK